MARNLDPKCRQCRREGEKLFLKGEKCFTDKCAIERRAYPPGQHGQKKAPVCPTTAGSCVKSRRCAASTACSKRQFRRNYAAAERRKGVTGENLLQMLESRLDNVVYRMGFGASRAEARQIVRHNGILVNGKRVNIPSYQVRPGDVVEVAEKSKAQLRIKAAARGRRAARHSRVDRGGRQGAEGTFKAMPQRRELPATINEQPDRRTVFASNAGTRVRRDLSDIAQGHHESRIFEATHH